MSTGRPSVTGDIWYDGTAVLRVPEKETSECQRAGWRYVVDAEGNESWILKKYLGKPSPSLPSLANLLDRLEGADCAVGGVGLTKYSDQAIVEVTCTIGGTRLTEETLELWDAMIIEFSDDLYLPNLYLQYGEAPYFVASKPGNAEWAEWAELESGEVVTVYWKTGLSVAAPRPTSGTSSLTTSATPTPTPTDTPTRPATDTSTTTATATATPSQWTTVGSVWAVSGWSSSPTGCAQIEVFLGPGVPVSLLGGPFLRCDSNGTLRCYHKIRTEEGMYYIPVVHLVPVKPLVPMKPPEVKKISCSAAD